MKKLKTICARALPVLLCLVLCLGLLPSTAYAYGAIDVDHECELTVRLNPADAEKSGRLFRAYKVGDVNAGVSLSLTEEWKDYPVTLTNLDVDGWRALASTLAGYVEADSISPSMSARTDANGLAVFDALETGVYLIMGQSFSEEVEASDGTVTTRYYTPEPFMMVLPYLDAEGEWDYEISVTCKYEMREDEKLNLRALKVWRYDDPDERPSYVQVALIRDGIIYDVQTLNRANAWRYDWTDLDGGHTWRMVELSRNRDYYTTVVRDGLTFVITNTYVEDIPETPTPNDPGPGTPIVWPEDPPVLIPVDPENPPEDIEDEPTPMTPWVTPDTPTTTTGTPTTTTPGTPDLTDIPEDSVPLEDLPQTGQLWWPVPVMLGAGALLFLLGRKVRGRDDE